MTDDITAHYKTCDPIYEAVKVIRAWIPGWSIAGLSAFNLGNALKYIQRAPHKGSCIKDLKKAITYLQDEVDYLEGKTTFSTPNLERKKIEDYYVEVEVLVGSVWKPEFIGVVESADGFIFVLNEDKNISYPFERGRYTQVCNSNRRISSLSINIVGFIPNNYKREKNR
jgi:hypothetical protein